MMPFTMHLKYWKKVIRLIIPLAFWLGVWQIAAMLVGAELRLPTPWAVLRCLGDLAVTGEFWLSTLYTLVRVMCGLLGGILAGVALGVLTH